MSVGINIGCGPKPIHSQHIDLMNKEAESWVLVDLYVSSEHVYRYDAKDIPVKDGEFDVVYSSHLLEHISYKETRDVLNEWMRILKNGGKMIINVPDLEWISKLLLGHVESDYWEGMEGDHGMLNLFYGSQLHEGELHRTGFTKEYLNSLLRDVGLQDINIKKKIEAHQMQCLIAEGVKK